MHGVKFLLEPEIDYCQMVPPNQNSLKININIQHLLLTKVYENVTGKVVIILFQQQWVS